MIKNFFGLLVLLGSLGFCDPADTMNFIEKNIESPVEKNIDLLKTPISRHNLYLQPQITYVIEGFCPSYALGYRYKKEQKATDISIYFTHLSFTTPSKVYCPSLKTSFLYYSKKDTYFGWGVVIPWIGPSVCVGLEKQMGSHAIGFIQAELRVPFFVVPVPSISVGLGF